ncbi:hypothetical protein B0H10DRAFT_1946643 [Mycena sp. CBHHK59/15]|nr:hypothetical protein B0H10DRAFT_1946643 [Mycena sp. CBHHK59/15]
MVDIDASSFDIHDKDEEKPSSGPCRLPFVLCTARDGSERLLNAQYVQSDIGFKLVVGFYQFEMAGWDRDATTSVVFCRVFLNRQTAVAHLHNNTGKNLQWHHIHSDEPEDDYGGKILQWAGLGLYLQRLAQAFPDKYDLYEVHQLMRSLVCILHNDWDGTVDKILSLGGKAAQDVNRDGVQCTLVGGILKGEFYDTMQMKTLEAFEVSGIHPSYQSGHPVESTVKNLKRKFSSYHKALCADDQKLVEANAKIEEAAQKIKKARDRIVATQTALSNTAAHASTFEKRSEAFEKARQGLEKVWNAYRKEIEAAKTLEATGKAWVTSLSDDSWLLDIM